MKLSKIAASIALLATAPAFAADYNFKVTSMMPKGKLIAPLIIVDAAAAEPVMYKDGYLSDLFLETILKGDPRPMGMKLGAAVAGPVLGKSGPPGVQIDGGEVATNDLFVEANTLRFFAKGSYGPGEDTVITGVWDISMGGGTLMLNRYDIGHSEGTKKITLVEEGVVKVEITEN